MGEFEKILFEKIEHKEVVRCLDKNCNGTIKQFKIEIEQYCEFYYEEIHYYKCDTCLNHQWKYSIEVFPD